MNLYLKTVKPVFIGKAKFYVTIQKTENDKSQAVKPADK